MAEPQSYPPIPGEAALIANMRKKFHELHGGAALKNGATLNAYITLQRGKPARVSIKTEVTGDVQIDWMEMSCI